MPRVAAVEVAVVAVADPAAAVMAGPAMRPVTLAMQPVMRPVTLAMQPVTRPMRPAMQPAVAVATTRAAALADRAAARAVVAPGAAAAAARVVLAAAQAGPTEPAAATLVAVAAASAAPMMPLASRSRSRFAVRLPRCSFPLRWRAQPSRIRTCRVSSPSRTKSWPTREAARQQDYVEASRLVAEAHVNVELAKAKAEAARVKNQLRRLEEAAGALGHNVESSGARD